MDDGQTENLPNFQQPQPIELPSLEGILDKKVSFPFDEFAIWTQAFNHMKVIKGKNVQVSSIEEKEGKNNYIISLPENPTLRQILQATKKFIETSGINVDNPRLLIFARDLKNSAVMLAKILPPLLESLKTTEEIDTEQIKSLISSIYNLGLGFEQILNPNTEDLTELPPLPETKFEDLIKLSYDLPEGTDTNAYENEMFLRLLGKHHIYFDEQSQQDKKLSQVVEHSAYYYLLKRFVEKRANNPNFTSIYEKQVQQFDQWLIDHKLVILKNLIPYLPTSLSKDGRTTNSLWQNIISRVFSFLDQVVDEEGWKKAKESLTSPPLFTDLGEEIQEMLKELSLIKDTFSASSIDLSKVIYLSEIESIINKYDKHEYEEMSLFNLAEIVLEKAQEKKRKSGEPLTTLEKITYLWDLVQAYSAEETYKLTDAIKSKSFECSLRSYILGRLCQEFLPDEVAVHVVNTSNHVLLLVVDKSTNEAYWVDPTWERRYDYIKDERKPLLEDIKNAIKPLKPAEWKRIQSQIQAKPDDFNIFGQYNGRFSTILPFTQGIEAGFWNNLWYKFYDETLNEDDSSYLEKAYYAIKKALELDPNSPDYHNNLAVLYMDKKFAQVKGVDYKRFLLAAFDHLSKALELNPNNPTYHRSLALLYLNDEFAEAKFPNEADPYNKFRREAYEHLMKALKLDPK